MADSEPTDRLRGLGLLLQILPALAFTGPLSALLLYLLEDYGESRVFATTLPLAVMAFEYATGWMLVRNRPRAVIVAIAYVIVALAVAVWLVSEREDDAPGIAGFVVGSVAWPVVTLVSTIAGPRTPFGRRRADLGGVLIAYGVTLVLIAAITVIPVIAGERFGRGGWSLTLWVVPVFTITATGMFGILAGIELTGAARQGRSRLSTYLAVTVIVTIAIVALQIAAILISERLVSIGTQLVIAGISAAYLLAVPFVVWRYARRAKALDVPDSAAAAGALRWAAVFFAIEMATRIPGLFERDAVAMMFLGLSCVQILLAFVAFGTANRRRAMWSSLIIAAIAVATIVLVIVGSGARLASGEGVWPNLAGVALFGTLAWLHRPSVRGERSLAAIFE